MSQASENFMLNLKDYRQSYNSWRKKEIVSLKRYSLPYLEQSFKWRNQEIEWTQHWSWGTDKRCETEVDRRDSIAEENEWALKFDGSALRLDINTENPSEIERDVSGVSP